MRQHRPQPVPRAARTGSWPPRSPPRSGTGRCSLLGRADGEPDPRDDGPARSGGGSRSARSRWARLGSVGCAGDEPDRAPGGRRPRDRDGRRAPRRGRRRGQGDALLPAAGPSMKISVVIRSFNEEAHIGRLLDGALHQTMRPTRSSSSTPARPTPQWRSLRAPGVDVHVHRKAEFSFGRALNLGCRPRPPSSSFSPARTSTRSTTWLERLVAPFDGLSMALSLRSPAGATTTRFSEHQVMAAGSRRRSVPAQRHPFCNNANSAIRTDALGAQPYDESADRARGHGLGQARLDRGVALAYVAEAPDRPRPRREASRRSPIAIGARRSPIDGSTTDQEMTAADALRLAAANVVGGLRAGTTRAGPDAEPGRDPAVTALPSSAGPIEASRQRDRCPRR